MEFVLVRLFLGKALVRMGLNDGAWEKKCDADIVKG